MRVSFSSYTYRENVIERAWNVESNSIQYVDWFYTILLNMRGRMTKRQKGKEATQGPSFIGHYLLYNSVHILSNTLRNFQCSLEWLLHFWRLVISFISFGLDDNYLFILNIHYTYADILALCCNGSETLHFEMMRFQIILVTSWVFNWIGKCENTGKYQESWRE